MFRTSTIETEYCNEDEEINGKIYSREYEKEIKIEYKVIDLYNDLKKKYANKLKKINLPLNLVEWERYHDDMESIIYIINDLTPMNPEGTSWRIYISPHLKLPNEYILIFREFVSSMIILKKILEKERNIKIIIDLGDNIIDLFNNYY